jgi:hypothetical protein
MIFEHLTRFAAIGSLALLAFLICANVIIMLARTLNNRKLANVIIAFLKPVADVFRIGNPNKNGLGGR